jgi:RNA polymerase sigma-70 factor (ECF subfamily)
LILFLPKSHFSVLRVLRVFVVQSSFFLERFAAKRERNGVTASGGEFRVPFRAVGAESFRPESDLVARLARGDLAALGEAYDAHHAHVRAFACRLLGDESAAEDLLQETFIALPRAIHRFRGESSLRTFVVAIAVNRARHHLRGAMRRRAAHARFEADPPPSTPSPEDDARRRQLAATLTRALDALPIDQRVAVVLCEIEERTSAEAAQIVGVPEGTIRTRAFHGKRKLREALAEEGLR